MAKQTLLPGFKGLGKKQGERVLEIATGKTMSRRAYVEKIKRANDVIKKNEELAAFNKLAEPNEAYARPAKGRKSALKAPFEIKQTLAKALKENEEIKAANKAAARLEKITAKKQTSAKRIKSVKFTDASLKAGRRIKQYPVQDFAGLEAMIEQGQKSRNVLGYTWGIVGIDSRNPLRILTPTLSGSTAYDIADVPDEDEVNELVEDFIAEHSYFVYLHMWIKIIWKSDYAETKARKAGIQNKQYIRKDQR